MPPSGKSTTTGASRKPLADSSAAVAAFMVELQHPCKPEIEALRQIILGADPRIAEGIKWKSPSFRTGEYFATLHLRTKSGVALILHFGAKVRQLADAGALIRDPAGLLNWLAPDRAMVAFADLGAVAAKRAALVGIIQQWIAIHDS